MEKLKIDEIVVSGFYWFRLSDAWQVGEIEADSGSVYVVGSDESATLDDFPGVEIVGPIPYPVKSFQVDDKGTGI